MPMSQRFIDRGCLAFIRLYTPNDLPDLHYIWGRIEALRSYLRPLHQSARSASVSAPAPISSTPPESTSETVSATTSDQSNPSTSSPDESATSQSPPSSSSTNPLQDFENLLASYKSRAMLLYQARRGIHLDVASLEAFVRIVTQHEGNIDAEAEDLVSSTLMRTLSLEGKDVRREAAAAIRRQISRQNESGLSKGSSGISYQQSLSSMKDVDEEEVCMCVYMYVCVYVCVYVRMCICMYGWMSRIHMGYFERAGLTTLCKIIIIFSSSSIYLY